MDRLSIAECLRSDLVETGLPASKLENLISKLLQSRPTVSDSLKLKATCLWLDVYVAQLL